jgi:hypothetical protein
MGCPYKLQKLQDAETGTADGTELDLTDVWGGSGYMLGLQVTGVSGETITWEAHIDDAETWAGLQVTPLATGTAALTATANGLYRVEASALRKFRARISTGGSGAVTVTALLDLKG